MKSAERITLFISLVLILMLCAPAITAFAADNQDDEFIDSALFDGKVIGVQTASIYCETIGNYIKNPQVKYFRTNSDGSAAVGAGKIDAYISDEPSMQYYASKADNIVCKKIRSDAEYFGTIAPKSEEGKLITEQLNEFLAAKEKAGYLKELDEKWVRGDDAGRVMDDYSNLPVTNGELTIATPATFPPFNYVSNDQVVGYEIEMMGEFCKEYGYKLVVEIVEFDGLIAGVQTGKYDLGVSTLTISEERKKIVLFSEPYYTYYAGVSYREDSESGAGISLDTIRDGIDKTFLKEKRWKTFLSGIHVTLKITILSLILGTILGFLVHLVCRKGNIIAVKISAFARWLIQGMPEVVFLMIAYYIIFGKTSLGGETVAIIVFTLIFACVTHNLMESGENNLDPGQKIAAVAMGYSDMKAFINIILPQIARNFMPAYLVAVSTHIKATAVVGYIAVVDITKVGDIIRGATYEAFFPLIAVAILYFLMAGLLKLLIRLSTRKLNPETRSREQILKGATINDRR